MNTQKLSTKILLLTLTVLVAFGGVWQSASAGAKNVYPLKAGETIEVGKQGVFVSNIPVGVSHVFAQVVRDELPPRFNHDVDITYRAPPLEVRFLNDKGGQVDDISALVYVYFNIGKPEKQLWDAEGRDGISIWYTSDDGKWQKCFTFFVNEKRDNGKYDRLSCLAPGSGYYVLGHVDFDKELYKPNYDTRNNAASTNSVTAPQSVRIYIPD